MTATPKEAVANYTAEDLWRRYGEGGQRSAMVIQGRINDLSEQFGIAITPNSAASYKIF